MPLSLAPHLVLNPPFSPAVESSVRGAGHVPRLLLIWTCSVNAASWFPSGKRWPIWAAPSDRRCYFLLRPWCDRGEPVALIPE